MNVAESIEYLSVSELVRRYRGGSLSPVDAVEAAFRRLEQVEPKINAFCHVADREDCLSQARDSEARWHKREPKGLLDGVPITVKDTILAKGWPARRGSRLSDAAPVSEDSPGVQRMREEGAILLGKTTTPEFGWKGVTDSPLSGITRNPWNIDKTPGGSSGGSAAALAAGVGHAALGTDAGGSVRIPGSFCGLVAIKATVGRVPNYPLSAAGNLGHVGPMTHTVEDAALMLTIMAEPDPRDWFCLPAPDLDYRVGLNGGVRGLRIAWSPTLGYAKVEPEVAALTAKAIRVFEEMGATVEEVEAPFEDPTEVFRTHFFAGFAHAFHNFTSEQLDLLDPGLKQVVVEQARKVTLEDYMTALDRRGALGRATRAFHQKYDLLLTPTLAVAAFTAGRLVPEGWAEDWLPWAPFAFLFNLTGQPAATVPCGFTEAGLPVGLQVVGGLHQDALVLRAAQAYQSARPTLDRRPPL